MIQSLENAWGAVLVCMQKQLNPQSYNTWLAPTKQISANGNEIQVEVPNQFFKDWLIEHYSGHIGSALESLGIGHVSVSYTINSYTNNQAQTACAPAEKKQGFRLFPNPFERAPAKEHNFNQRYTFDNFVIGGCNRFAHAASIAVADSPAKAYNPLFIYGGVGLGKTHLMQAIGLQVSAKYPRLKVVYISSEKFTNLLISSIQNRTTQKFKDLYRSQDVLLVDDIQFIAGKESTQEEFFHTFNALYDAHKQIVISSDRPPKEIPALEKRLVSRFEWGLVTDVQAPDLETRVAILRKKIEHSRAQVDNDVLMYIAERVKTNIRELEGALIRVVAYASLAGHPVTIASAQEVLKESEAACNAEVSVHKIQGVVSEFFGIAQNMMRAKKRTKQVSFPRQVAMYLSRELTKTPLTEIGGFFGGRDHTTVLHACGKIETCLENDPQLKKIIENLVTQLKACN